MSEYKSPGVYVQEIEPGGKPIAGVGTSTAGFVGMTQHIATGGFDNDTLLNRPVLVTGWDQFVGSYGRYEHKTAPYLPPAVHGFFANGGSSCYVVRVRAEADDRDYIGADDGSGGLTGLQALSRVDDVHIVCIPGITSKTVQRAMIAHCEKMMDRVCILDPEKDADITAIQSQKEGVVSAKGFAALYYPWIKVPVETHEGSELQIIQEFIPPSGHVAGIYARTDTERGVHKAPANEPVVGALELKVPIAQSQQAILNPRGINCIRALPGRGIRVWGARTTALDPEWKYVNVRRFLLYLEASIGKGTRWAVFEKNTEKLWAEVSNAIYDFLTRRWREGALTGAKHEEAFFVKCDRTTMTQDDIAQGKLICIIGVAPAKPAEFIIFRVSHTIDSQN